MSSEEVPPEEVPPADGTAGLVRVESVQSARVLTMNNPAKRNSLSLAMRHQLAEAVREAVADDDCRVLVLTGAQGHFSGGGDLSAPKGSAQDARDRMHAVNDTVRALANCPKPVVAAVDGAAYGVGLSLAVACDLVVASDTARFCAPFTGIGLTADGGLHHTLPRRIGSARARRMILTGTVVDARVAEEWGLADVLAEQDALAGALELAEQLAARAPLALAASREILARPDRSLDDVLEAELAAQITLLASEDFQEGKAAFFEKRPPHFGGT